MADLMCAKGCDELPASGTCRVCGYSGPGVPEAETDFIIDHDGGRWFLRERLRPLFFVAVVEEPGEEHRQ